MKYLTIVAQDEFASVLFFQDFFEMKSVSRNKSPGEKRSDEV